MPKLLSKTKFDILNSIEKDLSTAGLKFWKYRKSMVHEEKYWEISKDFWELQKKILALMTEETHNNNK